MFTTDKHVKAQQNTLFLDKIDVSKHFLCLVVILEQCPRHNSLGHFYLHNFLYRD